MSGEEELKVLIEINQFVPKWHHKLRTCRVHGKKSSNGTSYGRPCRSLCSNGGPFKSLCSKGGSVYDL